MVDFEYPKNRLIPLLSAQREDFDDRGSSIICTWFQYRGHFENMIAY